LFESCFVVRGRMMMMMMMITGMPSVQGKKGKKKGWGCGGRKIVFVLDAFARVVV
jgi:hypothetical protein